MGLSVLIPGCFFGRGRGLLRLARSFFLGNIIFLDTLLRWCLVRFFFLVLRDGWYRLAGWEDTGWLVVFCIRFDGFYFSFVFACGGMMD